VKIQIFDDSLFKLMLPIFAIQIVTKFPYFILIRQKIWPKDNSCFWLDNIQKTILLWKYYLNCNRTLQEWCLSGPLQKFLILYWPMDNFCYFGPRWLKSYTICIGHQYNKSFNLFNTTPNWYWPCYISVRYI